VRRSPKPLVFHHLASENDFAIMADEGSQPRFATKLCRNTFLSSLIPCIERLPE
jgi:hypothetical protein